MPPLFVDGVEINELFVDGVEQGEAYADGVLVFDPGEYMFDDMGRSANGTPLNSHIMNTGHRWDNTSANVATIQTFHGLQQAYFSRTGNIGGAGFTMLALPETGVAPVAYHARAVAYWNRPSPAVLATATRALIYRRAAGVVQDTIQFNYSPDPANTLVTGISVQNFVTQLQVVPMPWANVANVLSCVVEYFTDGISFQGRVTANGQTAITSRFPVGGVAPEIAVSSTENFFGNTLKEAAISEWELEEYAPARIPWPGPP